ncbi:MAG: hypothetical protein WD512_07310 [Candidatus Paceibacterota bacterium]
MDAIYKIRLNGPSDIVFDDHIEAEDGINFQSHITKDIFSDNSNVVIGKKKSYLLYHGFDYKMLGYMHSLSYAIDVIRSRIATHISNENDKKKYEIHVKRVKENTVNVIKIYLYVAAPGWIYNGLSLVNKFKIVEVPKVELHYVRFL